MPKSRAAIFPPDRRIVPVAGVVVAGGSARRMGGGDKCLLDLDGATVLEHVIARLRLQVPKVVLNAGGDASRFARFGVPVIPDGIAGQPGPLAGVLAGMDWAAAEGFGSIVTVPGDTPFFPEDLVVALRAAAVASERPLVLALSEEPGGKLLTHPVCALWPVVLRERLRQDIVAGARKVRAWAEAQGAARAIFHDRHDPFFNINTPEDLAAARMRLVETSAA
ncbi:MAG: molybdenum cofactor guanylyltransferase MobA [Rhodobacteraceae bacterium]|nr:molybdenum cofactor guanylyltransferase MobA [Paracoccaceae bacterium]